MLLKKKKLPGDKRVSYIIIWKYQMAFVKYVIEPLDFMLCLLPDGCEGVRHRLVVAGAGAGFSWLLLLLLASASRFSSVIARG
jgi:hypothetical protein